MTLSYRMIITTAALAALVTSGCKSKSDAQPQSAEAPASTKTPAATLPANLFAQEAPADARTVAALKADANAKGAVVVQGRIGGRKDPFVDGVAMFLLADASMKSCDELHGDTCKTPWDYCCEPMESLAAKIATIQVVGEDGKPLRVNVQGQHGIEPLARVTVVGQIVSQPSGALVVNASKIYVASKG